MTAGIVYLWNRHNGEEVSATYHIADGDVCVTSIVNAGGCDVILSENEFSDLLLDISVERELLEDA